jgi:hypothetical protein
MLDTVCYMCSCALTCRDVQGAVPDALHIPGAPAVTVIASLKEQVNATRRCLLIPSDAL